MKILVMTNMGPSPAYPFSDAFVHRQVEMMRRLSIGRHDIEYFRLQRRAAGLRGSLIKYGTACVRFIPVVGRHYDIVHLYYGYPLLPFLVFYRMLHPRARVVVSLLGSDVNREMGVGIRRVVFGRLLRYVDHVIAVSRALAAATESSLGRRVDSVLSVGIDTEVFYRMPDLEKRYDVIFVGRFVTAKGIPQLLDAIRALRDPGLRICFAGSGPLLGQIGSLASVCDLTVKLSPTHDELRTLYNQSRFLILPSQAEGLPVVIGEAFVCGTPVIATRVGGVEELVVDGHNGFLLSELSPRAVAAKLRHVRSMPSEDYQAMSVTSQMGTEELSVEHVCRQQFAVYDRLTRRT